jgi:outer membrane biosynthesis protein TonB
VDAPKDLPVRDKDDRNLRDYPVSKSTHKMVLDAQKRPAGAGNGLLLSAVIDEKGNVAHMRILRLAFPTAPNTVALNEQAIEQVKRWHYKPTVLDGKPVPVYTEISVIIDLQ